MNGGSTSAVRLDHMAGACPYCSTQYSGAFHAIGSAGCRVKAIEYHPDGSTKRVEFKDA